MTKPRALLSAVVLLLSLTAFTFAARPAADVSGTWNVSVQTPDQTVGSVLVIQQKGDTLSGTLESDLGRAAINGMVKGDTVNFAFGLDMGGQALNIQASAVLTDKDTMNGQMDVSGMGGMPFSARRQQ